MTRKLTLGVLLLFAAIAAAVVTAASVGPYPIGIGDSISAVLNWAGLPTGSASATGQAVVESIRLPRIVLALVVGGALATAGVTLQALFRNPMADPGVLGVSAGGALGAVIAIGTGAAAAASFWLPASAFAGAAGALIAVYFIANLGGRFTVPALLLSGIAVSAFAGAAVSAVVTFTDNQDAQREMVFWLAGGLDSTGWSDVYAALPLVVLGCAFPLFLARDLNLLLAGEDAAQALGVRVVLVRNVLLVAVSLITGVAVAFSGTIAFVGLVVPHALRLVIGSDHRVLLPLSALGGALFLLIADTIARTAASPVEIRVGIITALAGAPFFVILLVRNKSKAGMV